jgi:hypothetical protein
VVLWFGMWDYVNDVGGMVVVMLVGLCYAPNVGYMHKRGGADQAINSNRRRRRRRRRPLKLCHGRWVGWHLLYSVDPTGPSFIIISR